MKARWLVTLLLGLVLFVAPVQAVPVLDFNMDANHPAGASISYAGGANPLVGVNISVDSVLGINTPQNNLVSVPFTGILTFTTGNYIGGGASQWTFAGGGSISVDIPGPQNLLTGKFSNARVEIEGTTGFRVVIGGFFDTKWEELTDFYGLPDGIYTGSMNLSFQTASIPPNALTSLQVLSGDIINTPGKVPEPISLILLGSGLAGVGLYRRFRKSK